jgi:hypothetical protein
VVIASTRRLSLCALAALLLLGAGDVGQAAPTRLAADQPELDLYPSTTVPGSTAGTMELDLYVPTSTEMAKVVLFVPAGYPPRGISGRVIGTGAGLAAAWDPNFLPTFGRIVAVDPVAYTTNTCAPGLHQAVWLVTLENTSDLPPTPILIDATTGTDTSLGGYRMQFCLPPSSSGTMKVHELDFLIGKLMNPATSGAYTWRAFVTPYKTGAPDDASTFELRGTIPMPMHLTLRGVYDRKHKRAILTGRLTAAGLSVTGAFLDLYVKRGANYRYVATTRVKSAGKFRAVRRIKTTTRFRIVTATLYDCDPGSPAPAGCVSDTLANIASPVAKVVVPKRRR